MKPEDQARETIDKLLTQAGWVVTDMRHADIASHRGVAITEFGLNPGHGTADYMLYVDGKAAGVIEAKAAGATLTGVEIQSDKYTKGVWASLPAWARPLPFAYQSTGIETRFTNGLDPEARSRPVFAFHRPETLALWLEEGLSPHPETGPEYLKQGKTFLARMNHMPPLIETGLWPPQIRAIKNLEKSLAQNHPRSLIQMATGSGKTFTAISILYRLIKFAGARRVLFLVDRGNLGRQTHKEFQQYVSPYNNFKFTEEFIVQRMSSNQLDKSARVCISTIQRMFSLLKGEELDESLEEESLFDHTRLFKEPVPVEYNPKIPIEIFDIIVTDECHRSIYNLWRQVLEYFDASLVGLTATPSMQTLGFFNQNLVMEYGHEQAVADGVNVNYDVYRIHTEITSGGARVEAGVYVDKRHRETRQVRWEQLDEDLAYQANQLDRDVVAVDQIRTVIRTFRDRLFTEIFPGRTEVPKTLIFAKDDSHAEDIVKIVREEFGKGNEFAQKITYRTTGRKPEELIAEFRNSYFPRIAVTVDMIATGTDIKPLEIVLFMRSVKSRSFFEQMKGRGVRVVDQDTLRGVTPDAKVKDHFVIVDAVGVCEQDKTESRPLEKRPNVSFEKLLQAVALGNTEEEVVSSLAGRLARLAKSLPARDQAKVEKATGGRGLGELASDLLAGIDPDRQAESAPGQAPAEPGAALRAALRPFHNPDLRDLLIELKRESEQVIDTVSKDRVLEAGFNAEALERAKDTVQSFERFLQEHKDEITALQVLYSKPYRVRLRFQDIEELAEIIRRPPHHWTQDKLWEAYAALEKSKVRGAGAHHILSDLVSLVRYASHQENELVPFPERVQANFKAWLGAQEKNGARFTDEQRRWLEMIRDHIAANVSIEAEDFDYAPFAQQGGLGKVHEVFGDKLNVILEELNETLAA